MKEKLLSIVIPVYNAEKYIRRCITSILELDCNEIEIILVDDGSTDNSLNICEMFAEREISVRVFSEKNSGVSAARNFGLRQCNGKYVSFVDADDWVLPSYKEIIKIIEINEYDIFFFNFANYYKKSIIEKKRSNLNAGENDNLRIIDEIFNGTIGSACASIYRMDYIKQYNIQFMEGLRIGEDSLFNMNYAVHCKTGYYINTVAYAYDQTNEHSAEHKTIVRDLNDYVVWMDKALEIYGKDKEKLFHPDTKYMLKKITIILFCSEYGKDCKEVWEFEESYLHKIILGERYDSKKDAIMQNLIKYKMYRYSIGKFLGAVLIRGAKKFGRGKTN